MRVFDYMGSRFYLTVLVYLLIPFTTIYLSDTENVCFKDEERCRDISRRYLFYDVNRPEGFNLRRDVYMRFAVLANKLKKLPIEELNKFVLVLPPWSHLVHWTYSNSPEQIPWEQYFDLTNLKLFAPVIEMHEFFDSYPNKYSKVVIDEVYNLQHFEDMFETGNFTDRMEVAPCQRKDDNTYFFYENVTSASSKCLSYHGPATKLTDLLLNTTAKTIMINHAEVALHDFFGSQQYWQARRSMRFNKSLKQVAADFRKKYLNSIDVADNTELPELWTDEKPQRDAFGGPYVAVHLRRQDFVRSRPMEAPSIKSAAKQIENVLEKLDLRTIFVATDGTEKEFDNLARLLKGFKIVKFKPSLDFKKKYKDGGVAIVDQIICSHSRYFIGTHESTFTFRIQEEREILGFHSDVTYNVFCSESGCPKPSIWKIVY